MCCGKGGDLAKWGTKVRNLVGIDLSSKSLEEMRKRWSNIRSLSPHVVRMDLRKPVPPGELSKFQVASCLFGLNYMDNEKGELRTLLTTMTSSLLQGGVAILMYANQSVVRVFKNTNYCQISEVVPGELKRGYNFMLGKMVDAVEYPISPSMVSAVMQSLGMVLAYRQGNLPFLGNSVRWEDKSTGKPDFDAMTICNLYSMDMWIRGD